MLHRAGMQKGENIKREGGRLSKEKGGRRRKGLIGELERDMVVNHKQGKNTRKREGSPKLSKRKQTVTVAARREGAHKRRVPVGGGG